MLVSSVSLDTGFVQTG